MLTIQAQPISRAAFAPFGRVIEPQTDGGLWSPGDAEPQLDQGPPRLYLMRLAARGLSFRDLAGHQRVTQCLGVMDPHPWHLVVGAPQLPADPPLADLSGLRAFTVPPRCILQLHRGTWHAGPLFEGPAELVFCNLELRDTTRTDTSLLRLQEGLVATVRP